MVAGSVFISYRRDDAAGEAGRLSDHLTRHFGPGRIFIDIDTIAPGADFTVELERALGGTKGGLVIIGRGWLTAADGHGRRRLDDPEDFVRREIVTALQRDSRVVPVLVQNAAMPAAEDLPEVLRPLAHRQAMAIQHEEFAADAGRLADAIAPLLDLDGTDGRWRPLALASIAAGVLLALGLGGWQWQRSRAAAEATALATQGLETAQRSAQQTVDDRVRVAAAQKERGSLSDALATLATVAGIDADTSAAKALEEDVAMQWIRDLSVPSGQKFGDALKPALAILDRSAPFANGPRQGDLLAHVGWATYLRWRDGEVGLDPTPTYRKALTVDPTNPYANAMLGHWLLSQGDRSDAMEQARPLFRTAIDAGRATDVVRGFQLAALGNASTSEYSLETIRVLDEMRRRGEGLRPGAARRADAVYFFAVSDEPLTRALLTVVPPAEHLRTLGWALDEYSREDESRTLRLRYYTARLQAAAGDPAAARRGLQTLQAELRASSGSLRDAVDRALKGLETTGRR
jgi:type II secretory pathway pseudopilin PulG